MKALNFEIGSPRRQNCTGSAYWQKAPTPTIFFKTWVCPKKGFGLILMGEFFTFNGVRNKFLRPNLRTVKKGKGFLRSFGPVVWKSMLPDKVKSCLNLNIS